MTVLESVRELQTRYIDGVKATQEQIVSYNEKVAETFVGATADWQIPLAERLPKPTKLVDAYFGYVGEMHELNKSFAGRIAKAWESVEESVAHADADADADADVEVEDADD